MFTTQEAKDLIDLEKILSDPNQIINLGNKKNRLELSSAHDSNYNFWVEITSNKKIILKTSIHHLESNSFTGLLRIDFKGGHKNPSEVKNTLPKFLEPYVGKWFNPSEPHMHVFVEGYQPLVWAMPLSDTDFPTKVINSQSDLADLIVNFAKEINLMSQINIQQALF